MRIISILAVVMMLAFNIIAIVDARSITSVYDEIKTDAQQFKDDNKYISVSLIDSHVEEMIQYELQKKDLSIYKIWELKKGDCTEKAKLKCMYAKYINIPCRVVHGYAYFDDTEKFRHDWVEFKPDKEWISYEQHYFYKIKKTGNGQW